MENEKILNAFNEIKKHRESFIKDKSNDGSTIALAYLYERNINKIFRDLSKITIQNSFNNEKIQEHKCLICIHTSALLILSKVFLEDYAQMEKNDFSLRVIEKIKYLFDVTVFCSGMKPVQCKEDSSVQLLALNHILLRYITEHQQAIKLDCDCRSFLARVLDIFIK